MDYLYRAADPAITPPFWGAAVVLFLFSLFAAAGWNWFYKKQVDFLRIAGLSCLITYVFLVLSSTVLCRTAGQEYTYELMPFWSYARILGGDRELLCEDILNCFLLLPVGILIPMVFRAKARGTVLCGAFISVSIEVLQLIFKKGLFEFDDMFHNTLGCLAGYGAYHLCSLLVQKRQKREY